MEKQINQLLSLLKELQQRYSSTQDPHTSLTIAGYESEIKSLWHWSKIAQNEDYKSILLTIKSEINRIEKRLVEDRSLSEKDRLHLMDRRDLYKIFEGSEPVETEKRISNLYDTITNAIKHFDENYKVKQFN